MPMVCTADDLLGWKDFPKGLRVLLLDEDTDSATQITSKLEDMDYVVSSFRSENEALSAISDDSKCFHVAIVEVREDNKDGRFRFLESTKDLPTIMTSDVNCISTMMKCIALGAVEFLEKPISEDKLRNIWQHVAHKAFNGGPTEALKSSDLNKVIIKEEKVMGEIDKYPAPSTPQLKQGTRSVDDHMDQDQTTQKEFEGQSKFVEPTCNAEPNGNAPTTTITITDTLTTTTTSSVKSLEEDIIGQPSSSECCPDPITDATQASPKKSSRRKIKVDWTSELHKKFVEAVEQLGVDQAIPSRILELMNVEGLTRHNVASHLQKYRLQRRHILPKDGGRKWPQTRHSTAAAGTRNSYPQKPIMAYPPPPPLYPAWPLPHTTYTQMWAPPYYHPWHSSDNWIWNSPYSGVQAQTWGCPTHASFHQNTSEFQSRDSMHNRHGMAKNSFDNYPGEEVIDKIVKEAINKPWLPLPLGLKPPSTESVISELSKQGISTIPPAAASID